MSIPENIQRLADKVRKEIYGRDVRESIASSMEATAEVAEWSRKVAQDIVDGKFDEGELATEIERKLNELETEYAPRLDEVTAQLAQTQNEKVGAGVKAELEDLSPSVLSALEGGEGTSFDLLSIPQSRSVTLNKLDMYLENRINSVNEIVGDDVDVTVNYQDFTGSTNNHNNDWTFVLAQPAPATGNLTFVLDASKSGNPQCVILDKTGEMTFEVVKKTPMNITKDGLNEIDTGEIIEVGQYVGIINDHVLTSQPTEDNLAYRFRGPVEGETTFETTTGLNYFFYYKIGGRVGEIQKLRNEINSSTSDVSGLIQVKTFGEDGDAIIDALSTASYGDTVVLEPQTYITTKTIVVPFGVTLKGRGHKSKIKLADAPYRDLTGYWWRSSGNVGYPIVVNEFVENSESRSEIQGQSPNFVNFSIEGNTDIKSPQGERIIGLLVSNVENGTIDRVHVENIDYHPEGGVGGFGIVTRYCNNVRIYDPTGKNCGYENLGIYDGSKNVTVYNPQFGNAGRVSGQVHRGTKNITFVGGEFVNAEKINPTDESPGAFTMHGNELSPIHNVTFVKTIFKAIGEETGRAVNIFGEQYDTNLDDVFIESKNGGGIEAYGERLKFSGTIISKDDSGYGAIFGGKDIDIKPKIYSEGSGINFGSSSYNATLEDFYIESKSFGIRSDSPTDFFAKNGQAKTESGTALYQSSLNLEGFYVVDDCILQSETGTAISLVAQAPNRDKTIIKNSHLESGGNVTADVQHSDMKFSGNTVIGTLRLRNNEGCLVKDNDLRKATLAFVDTSREDHIFINNIES